MSVESAIIIPPFSTVDSNLSSEGRFIAIKTLGVVIIGEPTFSSLTITLQLAVPPRISGP